MPPHARHCRVTGSMSLSVPLRPVGSVEAIDMLRALEQRANLTHQYPRDHLLGVLLAAEANRRVRVDREVCRRAPADVPPTRPGGFDEPCHLSLVHSSPPRVSG